ncbi:hypothetical protein PQ459_10160 [Chryseobacterium sp. KACC 21268]|nr:hypothetical protein PQ459_10160 [Chryseobacterium sp. KACC 21268]
MEKLIDQASKILADTSDIILDRFKNPYITAFSISWIIFNWKAIMFFVFSKGNVEYKIKQISIHHSDLFHTFLYPFGVTIVYLFGVPYLNQANEWFLKKSVKNRANFKKVEFVDKIERERDIAIAIDEQQTAIKNARESTEHNKYIDELKNTIDEKDKIISEQRSRDSENNMRALDEQSALLKNISDLQTKHNKEIDKLRNELNEKQIDNNQIIRENQDLKISIENKNSQLNDVNFRADKFQEILRDSQNVIDVQKEIRFNQSTSTNALMISFDNGDRILEINTDSPYPKYINYNLMRTLSIKDVNEKLKSNSYSLSAAALNEDDKNNILSVVYKNDMDFNNRTSNEINNDNISS